MSLKGEAATEALSQLQSALTNTGIKATVIYSGGADVDILAAGASKGKGLEFLLKQVTSVTHLLLKCNANMPNRQSDRITFPLALPAVTK